MADYEQGNQENQRQVPSIKDFKLLNRLGVGAFAKVYLTEKISPGPDKGKFFAVKAILKSEIIKTVFFVKAFASI